jgi:valyl-tRNA synthetase
LNEYKFSLAGEKLQKFTWDELADWYLEINKMEKNKKVLGYVLDKILKLWHPFAPFITEKISGDLTLNKKMLMVASWPTADKKLVNRKAEKEFENLQKVIGQVRNIRAVYHIDPAKIIRAQGKNIKNIIVLEKLARLKIVNGEFSGKEVKAGNLKLDIAGVVNMNQEKIRRQKEKEELEKAIEKSGALLKNEDFIKNAPKEIIEKNKKKLEEYKNKLKKVL